MNVGQVTFRTLGAIMVAWLASCTDRSATDDYTTAAIATAANVATPTVILGSSNILTPLNQMMADEFSRNNNGIRVAIRSNTAGEGLKDFCAGKTDIATISRAISKSEDRTCQKNGVAYIELPIGIDGLTIVVNKENTWATCLTVEELKKIWSPMAEGKITDWNQIRPEFPNEALTLFAPNVNSGALNYFTEVVNGQANDSRKDFQIGEDRIVLIEGVIGSKGSMSILDGATFAENAHKLIAVAIDRGDGCVAPTPENVRSGKYKPFSRLLTLYVNKRAIARPEVAAFVKFYLSRKEAYIAETSFVSLPEEVAAKVSERIQKLQTGAAFLEYQNGDVVSKFLGSESKHRKD